MTLADIKGLQGYHAWAMERVVGVLETLTPEQYEKDSGSSHGGIRGTLLHIIAAQEIWVGRWTGQPRGSALSETDFPTFADAKRRWEEAQSQLNSFLDGLSDDDLTREVVTVNSRGERFATPLWQTIQHFFNHSTYHRGQITTLLRLLGVKPIATDLIVYYRQQ